MDIDIDTQSKFNPKDIFPNVTLASMVERGELIKHNVGVYFQNIAKDSETGLAAIPFREAEDEGYFKVDFLHLSALDHFESKDEMRSLLRIEPDWNLLQVPGVVKKLFQIHSHFDTISLIRPKSIEDLADCLAIIRPNKRRLLNEYLKNKEKIKPLLYRRPNDPDRSAFRRSHAIAYATTIVLQLHLVKANLI